MHNSSRSTPKNCIIFSDKKNILQLTQNFNDAHLDDVDLLGRIVAIEFLRPQLRIHLQFDVLEQNLATDILKIFFKQFSKKTFFILHYLHTHFILDRPESEFDFSDPGPYF